jgi:hypothetical protein
MAALEITVRGGDGDYSFFWEGQEIDAVQVKTDGRYFIQWSWEQGPQVGTLTVVSGDNQRATRSNIFIAEPTCP